MIPLASDLRPFPAQMQREDLLEVQSCQTDFLHLAASPFWALLLEAVER
jgi:hypothetical protein